MTKTTRKGNLNFLQVFPHFFHVIDRYNDMAVLRVPNINSIHTTKQTHWLG